MPLKILLVVVLAFALESLALDKSDLNRHYRDPDPVRQKKVFSLFSIVTFQNAGCRSASGSTGSGVNRNGTCYTSTECSDRSGTASGNCAAGFGVCCLFIVNSATTTINENCTYIQNPNFPASYASSTALTFTVAKCATDVCSLRIDFESFHLGGPTSTLETGSCEDTFQITSTAGLTYPVICGINQGEHVYVDMSTSSTGTATLAFTFGTTTSTTRIWELKLSQIECSSLARPYDTGCLQYYTGLTGRITTFNFQDTSAPIHLNSQRYDICIRAEDGYCCAMFTPCTDSRSWSLDNTANSMVDTNCDTDYVGFSSVADTCTQSSNTILHSRLCGGIFSVTDGVTAAAIPSVCDCSRPFTVEIVTDATNDGTAPAAATMARGTCLNYLQQSCATT